MPTYEYACTSCGEHLEVVQSFKDDPLTTCANCSGSLRKVFSPIGVVFKGSGFYKTDSRDTKRPPGATKEPAATAGADASSKGSSDGTASTAASGGSSSNGSSGAGAGTSSTPVAAAS